MKHYRYLIISILLVFNSLNALGQHYRMPYKCSEKKGNAVYLRDFSCYLSPKKRKKLTGTKWAIQLNKNKNYRFNFCCSELKYKNEIEMRLFDNENTEYTKPLGISHETKFGSPGFDFECEKTGIYYVSIRYKYNFYKKLYVVGILSYVEKQ